MKFSDGRIREQNLFIGIPDCDICHYAAGIFKVMGGPIDTLHICPWCHELYKEKVKDLWWGKLNIIEGVRDESLYSI